MNLLEPLSIVVAVLCIIDVMFRVMYSVVNKILLWNRMGPELLAFAYHRQMEKDKKAAIKKEYKLTS